MKKSGSRYTLTDEKSLTLFVSYLNVIKQHGEYSTKITVRDKVEEAARPLYIGIDRARKIIGRMLKERGKTNKISITECNEVLEELRKLEQFKTSDSSLDKLQRMDKKIIALNNILIRVGIDRTHDEVKALVQEYLVNS